MLLPRYIFSLSKTSGMYLAHNALPLFQTRWHLAVRHVIKISSVGQNQHRSMLLADIRRVSIATNQLSTAHVTRHWYCMIVVSCSFYFESKGIQLIRPTLKDIQHAFSTQTVGDVKS